MDRWPHRPWFVHETLISMELEAFSAFSDVAGLASVFLVCVFCGIGLPFPEDLPLLLAGWQIRDGHLPAVATCCVALLAVFIRDCLAFSLGHLARKGMESTLLSRLADSRLLQWMLARAGGSGWGLLLIARVAAGIRVPVFLAAGLSGVSYGRFMVVEAVGVTAMVPATLWLGWYLGESVGEFASALQDARWKLAVLLILAAWFVFRHSRAEANGVTTDDPPRKQEQESPAP